MLLNSFFSAPDLLSHCQKKHHRGSTYHIPLSLLIIIEHMSQDTYSLSYGNFIPDTMFSCRPLGFLYHIMITTFSLDTANSIKFILSNSVSGLVRAGSAYHIIYYKHAGSRVSKNNISLNIAARLGLLTLL